MQNYSQALDVDVLNQRYWHRRMQQCKAEFKANHPRPSAPISVSKSASLSSNASIEESSHSSSHFSPRHSRSNSSHQSRPSVRTVMPKPLDSDRFEHVPDEQPSQPEPKLTSDRNGTDKGRPIPATSKPSRPIKYQVR